MPQIAIASGDDWGEQPGGQGDITKIQLLQRQARVRPITTADYPTPARRPSYSLLECTASHRLLDLPPCHWRTALRQVLQQLPSSLPHPR